MPLTGAIPYFCYPEDMESHDLFEYTLMPMHNRSLFELYELEAATLYRGFSFTKNAPVLKLPAFPAQSVPRARAALAIHKAVYRPEI